MSEPNLARDLEQFCTELRATQRTMLVDLNYGIQAKDRIIDRLMRYQPWPHQLGQEIRRAK
jgi:hypothetical protein